MIRWFFLLSILVLTPSCAAGPKPSPGGPRKATFEVRHELKVTVPEGAHTVRVWFTMPQEDPEQTVSGFAVNSPVPHRIERDSAGNKAVYLEVKNPRVTEFTITESFTLTRREIRSLADPHRSRPLTEEDRRQYAQELMANEYVVLTDEIRTTANQIVGNEQDPVRSARKLYDWVLDNIDYWVKDPKNKKASPMGSTHYCLTTRTGNCSDFNSLWTSLARSRKIPTRIVYGSVFKPDLDGKDEDVNFHCWVEFYAPGIGWISHDVSLADLFAENFSLTNENEKLIRLAAPRGYRGPDPAEVDYYFGNIDERRVVWSRGRDLMLSPRQDGGPVNALAKAYVEVDGKAHPEKTGWVRTLTYREVK